MNILFVCLFFNIIFSSDWDLAKCVNHFLKNHMEDVLKLLTGDNGDVLDSNTGDFLDHVANEALDSAKESVLDTTIGIIWGSTSVGDGLNQIGEALTTKVLDYSLYDLTDSFLKFHFKVDIPSQLFINGTLYDIANKYLCDLSGLLGPLSTDKARETCRLTDWLFGTTASTMVESITGFSLDSFFSQSVRNILNGELLRPGGWGTDIDSLTNTQMYQFVTSTLGRNVDTARSLWTVREFVTEFIFDDSPEQLNEFLGRTFYSVMNNRVFNGDIESFLQGLFGNTFTSSLPDTLKDGLMCSKVVFASTVAGSSVLTTVLGILLLIGCCYCCCKK